MSALPTNRVLEGKVALITGGGSGIGRATAKAMAQAGARVVIGNRNLEQGASVVAEIGAAGGEALFQPTDVRDSNAVRALVERACADFGRLDLAFNNAGTGTFGLLHETADAEAQDLLAVNVLGVYYAMKHELTRMLGNPCDAAGEGRGVIVNCSSIFGLRGFKSMALYSATKHAVSGLTRAAALDYARSGIRINAVAPGPIATPALGPQPDVFASYVPMARLGRPEEVASSVVWLCSDAASYMTGHVLPVDGGVGAACDPANSAQGGNR
jgi:NAD(P)-dependent dehydrogenase (short-subunit alcohol dehydrogenase family)